MHVINKHHACNQQASLISKNHACYNIMHYLALFFATSKRHALVYLQCNWRLVFVALSENNKIRTDGERFPKNTLTKLILNFGIPKAFQAARFSY